jgi:predicted kinase
MRKMIIMRGLPGSGKSTWIKQRGLEDYTLCPDKIRKMLCNPVMCLELPFHSVNQGKDEIAWSLLFKILEMRMREGQFTVIDATTLTADQFHRYKELIKKYKYRTLIVDFTDMPLEEIKGMSKEEIVQYMENKCNNQSNIDISALHHDPKKGRKLDL